MESNVKESIMNLLNSPPHHLEGLPGQWPRRGWGLAAFLRAGGKGTTLPGSIFISSSKKVFLPNRTGTREGRGVERRVWSSGHEEKALKPPWPGLSLPCSRGNVLFTESHFGDRKVEGGARGGGKKKDVPHPGEVSPAGDQRP